MSAVQKQTVEYFPHFVRVGVTRKVLEARYGNDGYAFWFKLLETLCTCKNHVFDFNHNLSRLDFLTFVRIPADKAMEILDLLAFELDVIDKELWKTKRIIWSQNLVDYLAPVYQKRKVKEKPARPHSAPASDGMGHSGDGIGADNPIPVTESSIPVSESPEVKRERKEREVQAEKNTPLLGDVQDFCKARNSPVDPVRFFNYYQAFGWKKSGQVILDWQALVEYWETLEKKKAANPMTATAVNLHTEGNRAIDRSEEFHKQAIVDGICRYCGQRPGFYPRLDNTPSVVAKPCACEGYQDGFKQAARPEPTQLTAN